MVLDEQHREVEPLAQLEEEVAECRHLLVAQAAGRLVEQQQPRLETSARASSMRFSVGYGRPDAT